MRGGSLQRVIGDVGVSALFATFARGRCMFNFGGHGCRFEFDEIRNERQDGDGLFPNTKSRSYEVSLLWHMSNTWIEVNTDRSAADGWSRSLGTGVHVRCND